jgi:3-oxoacyl-[acyl-carrier protein] reductase
LARDVAKYNVTVNNVLPGPFDTDRLRAIQQHLADQRGKSIEVVRERAAAAIPAGRFGDPAEFGTICAFLSSAHAGFITGQNIVIDGGEYPGLL